jgi:hypothetical protein
MTTKAELIEQIKAEKADIAEFSKALKLARAYKKIHEDALNTIITREAEDAENEKNQAILQECFNEEFKQ